MASGQTSAMMPTRMLKAPANASHPHPGISDRPMKASATRPTPSRISDTTGQHGEGPQRGARPEGGRDTTDHQDHPGQDRQATRCGESQATAISKQPPMSSARPMSSASVRAAAERVEQQEAAHEDDRDAEDGGHRP